MKLHNKKTGEIVDTEEDYFYMTFSNAVRPQDGFTSIKNFNEIWEDYTQAEPLIKDEKVRKAVRAWAEANGVKKVNPRGVGDTLLYFIGEDKGNELIEIEFYANVDDYTHLAKKILTPSPNSVERRKNE